MHGVLIHSQRDLHISLLFLIVFSPNPLEIRFNYFDADSFESVYIVSMPFLLFMIPSQDCCKEYHIFKYFIRPHKALSKQLHIKPFELMVSLGKNRMI